MDMGLIHDLRLNLQLIQASAQMLAVTAQPEAQAYLDMLLDGAAQMRRMLDVALAAAGPALMPTDAVECLRLLCLRCRDYADQRGVILAFTSNVDALKLVTDPDRLSRIALNLVMNALRFTPPGKSVTVALRALGDFLEIAVADEGRGIAPERLPYLFLRGETDGGSGFGLPAASEGARLLGGSLTATSAPGRGSTFILRLPVRGAMVS